jgi:hypothetical protein
MVQDYNSPDDSELYISPTAYTFIRTYSCMTFGRLIIVGYTFIVVAITALINHCNYPNVALLP